MEERLDRLEAETTAISSALEKIVSYRKSASALHRSELQPVPDMSDSDLLRDLESLLFSLNVSERSR